MNKFSFLVLICVITSLLYAEDEATVREEGIENLLQISQLVGGDSFSPENYLRRKEKEKPGACNAQSSSKPVATKTKPSPRSVSAALPKTTPATDPASRLQIGGNYTYAKISPQGHPDFSGSLGGLQALYEYKTWNRIYGGLKLAWRQGSTDGSSGKRTLLDVGIEERIGYTFGDQVEGWMLSLFSGFGFRHLGEDVSTAGSSVTFNYNELYLPLGALSNYQFNSVFALGFDLTWMPQVYPTVTIVPLKGARWILTNKIANFLAEVPLTFTISRKYHCTLILKPFFEFWQDGHTTAKTEFGTTLHIPHNNYLFGGVDLNFCYAF